MKQRTKTTQSQRKLNTSQLSSRATATTGLHQVNPSTGYEERKEPSFSNQGLGFRVPIRFTLRVPVGV